ncbi:PE-PPE domain-containing protein [Mycolicibacterium brisbanense]|nr:PE-PPE domain-containing protein [Mycolicibacterium brisbanense]MCV7156171.1 PE-PPE domain-containing protein [Mycolicibacterium brisbanense]
MRRVLRTCAVVMLAMATTVVLAGAQTMVMPLVLLTATALIMGGTGHPLSSPQDSPEFIETYTNDATNNYIVLTGFCGAESCTPTAVSTPEEFMPVSGTMPFDQSVAQGRTNLDQAINAQPAGTPIVVFGYSQSARIASIEKRDLAASGSTLPVSFVLIGNPNRPNGGVLSRFQGQQIPILGVTFDGATPTNTSFKTVDITRQYDGWSDFPLNPLNPFATANAVAGIYYVHGDYQSVGLGNAIYQGSYGDTQYYMIPSNRLPLLMPLAQAGVPDPVLAVVDAPTRVLVESGYDRTVSPGQPTGINVLYFPNPAQTGVNFIVAIPTGLDDGAQEAANIRPFGTPPVDQRSPYGVGGPPVNAGSFDSNGVPVSAPTSHVAAPVATTAPSVPAAQPAVAQPPAGALPIGPRPGGWQQVDPKPVAAPSVPAAATVAQVPPVTPPKRDLAMPWSAPAQTTPQPLPLALPGNPAPVQTPPKVEISSPAPILDPPKELPVKLPTLPTLVPKAAPVQADPELPAAVPDLPPLPVAPAPFVPDLPAAPPPMLPPPVIPAFVPPQMPALPPPPPMPALPNILGGFHLPF